MKRLSTLYLLAAALIALCGAAPCAKPGTGTTTAVKAQPVIRYSPSDRVYDVSFAAKAPRLATRGCPMGPGRRLLQVWNTQTWTLCRTIDIGSIEGTRRYNTKALALSPDGRMLAYLSGGVIYLWDMATGNSEQELRCPVGLPVSIVWSLDGRRLAAGGDGSVRVFDAASGKAIRSFAASGDVAFSADGRTLGIAGGISAALFDIASGRKIRSYADKAGVQGPISLSPDGRYVATGGEDPTWDPGPPPVDEDGRIYSPSEAYYAHLLKVKVWDCRTGKLIAMLPGHGSTGGGTYVLQFSPDSHRLFSGGDGTVTLWDIGSRRAVRNFEISYGSALSPDGKMIAFGVFAEENGLRVYSVATGRLLMKTSSKAGR